MCAQVSSCPTLNYAERRELAHQLFQIGALNFQGVRLKTGQISPVYFDIRLTMSYPALLQKISRHLYNMITHVADEQFDLVTGVPAAAVALATALAIQSEIPMILTRKSAKVYGTKKMIEGNWKSGENVLVVEDVVTYGDSIAETTAILRSNGLHVHHATVVVERQQGATLNLLANHNVQLHALLTFDDIVDILSADGLIATERVRICRNFIKSTQYGGKSVTKFSLPLARRLSEIAAQKETSTCLLVDIPLTFEQILEFARNSAPRLAALQICPDLVSDTSPESAGQLRDLAQSHGLLLIADCKMTGSEQVTSRSLTAGVHLAPCRWADVITVHAFSGSGPLNAMRKLNETTLKRKLGALLIIDMESKDSLVGANYEDQCMELARNNADVVVGFIASNPLSITSSSPSGQGDSAPSVLCLVPSPNSDHEEKTEHCNGYSNGRRTKGSPLTTKTVVSGDSSVCVLHTSCISSFQS